ncbi:MAG: hypothetical protein Q9214_004856, partial [Letrouitia sp. 1 TL-2023]
QHHLAAIPFENVSLHYFPRKDPTQRPFLSLNSEDLFEKIVQRKHGGYCMELNCFFATALRSMGYTVKSVGARVCAAVGSPGDEDNDDKSGRYGGWSHMINIVTFPLSPSDPQKQAQYVVDVGFGAQGPSQPLLLQEGIEFSDARPLSMRLSYGPLPANEHKDSKLWRYEVKTSEAGNWAPMYCFTNLEFLPQDYEIMNFWTSTSPACWFTHKVVAARMLLDNKGGMEGVVGTVTMGGLEVKRKVSRGETEIVASFRSESDRVNALAKWFGIVLSREEKEGIRGTETHLGDDG